ncbi:MAG: DUF1553 domain-containing protein, partial [Planctomycetota bacterium]
DLDRSPGREHPFPSSSSWGFTQHGPFYAVYPTMQRSVYLMTQRLKRHPFLALFDGADTNSSTAKRTLTTTPTQALYLLNSDFVHERSQSLAKRILSKSEDDRERVRFAVQTALGKTASDREVETSLEFVAAQRAAAIRAGADSVAAVMDGWSAFSRTLLVRNDFLFLD